MVRPNAKLLHFESAAELDHRVEDLFHDVGVDQVALGFHPLLERKRLAVRRHSFGLGFQITHFPTYRIPALGVKTRLCGRNRICAHPQRNNFVLLS